MSRAAIVNPAGAFGLPTTSDGQAETAEVVAQTAITAKTVVALSTTAAQAVPAATNQAITSVLGVAVNGATAGNPFLVAVLGPIYGIAKDTGANIAQFDRLTISAAATGAVTNLGSTSAITQQKDIGQVIGIALAAAVTTATTVDAFLIRW